jgi:hypothetical protein
LIIKGLRQNIKNTHPTIARTLLIIRDMEQKFNEVSYFHIYKNQNGIVDSLAKGAKQFTQGRLKHSNEINYGPIP